MLNPLTGRKVQIGGRTYKNLVSRGLINQRGGNNEKMIVEKIQEKITLYIEKILKNESEKDMLRNILTEQIQPIIRQVNKFVRFYLTTDRGKNTTFTDDFIDDFFISDNFIYGEDEPWYITEGNVYDKIYILLKINKELLKIYIENLPGRNPEFDSYTFERIISNRANDIHDCMNYIYEDVIINEYEVITEYPEDKIYNSMKDMDLSDNFKYDILNDYYEDNFPDE